MLETLVLQYKTDSIIKQTIIITYIAIGDLDPKNACIHSLIKKILCRAPLRNLSEVFPVHHGDKSKI